MFRKSGYWRESEHEHSFMDRLSGLAKMAGIIGIGIATAPHWSRLTGRIGSTIAKKLPGKLTSDTVEAAIADVFGEEGQIFFNFSEQLQKQLATAVTRTRKVGKFLTDVGQYVDSGKSTAAFADVRDDLAKYLSAVGKVGDLSENEVEKVILNPDAMRYFTREAHQRGIVFQEKFYKEQRQIFERIVAETSKSIEPTRPEIMDFMKDPSNRTTVMNAFKHLHEHQQRRINMVHKFTNYEHMQDITFGHLEKPEVAMKVEKYLERIGVVARDKDGRVVQSPGPHDTFRVEEILEKARILREDPNKGLFTQETPKGIMPTSEASEYHQLMRRTSTGLAIDKGTGDVVSLALLRHQRRETLNTFMDEFQIPLVPFKFNIPLKMFKFMTPSDEPIRALGSLSNEPELARLGYGNSPYNQGMGIGEKLLVIDPINKNLNFVNEPGMRFVSYKKRDNVHAAKLLDVRSQAVKSYLNNFSQFGGAEDNYSEKFIQNYFNHQPNFTDLNYHPSEGFVITNKDTTFGKLLSPFIKKVHGNGVGVDVNKLHPTQLAEFLMGLDATNLSNMNPEHLKQAMGHIIREAKQARVDISPFLKQAGQKITSGEWNFDKNIPYYLHLTQMLQHADDPVELMRLLGQTEIKEAMGGVSSIAPSTLYKNSSSTFYMSINTLKNDMGALLDVTQGEAGLKNTWKSMIFGQTGISQAYEKLQEGLLAEVVRGVGVGNLDATAAKGGQFLTASEELVKIQEAMDLADTNYIKNSSLAGHFKDLGFIDSAGNIQSNELKSFLNDLVYKKDEELKINREALGKFGAAIVDKKTLFGNNDGLVKAKIMDDVRASLNDFEVFRDANSTLVHKQAAILYQMADDAEIVDVLRKRFVYGRPFHPEAPKLTPTNINNYLTTVSQAPSLENWFDNPVGALNSQIKRLFGAPEYIKSLSNPSQALGPLGLTTQALLQMPQEIANLVGLGLTGQDRITTLRSSLSFYGKRILPLAIGYEGYKNYNANMHHLGLPGLDDLGANILANLSLDSAKIKDTFGLTTINQRLVNTLPGLDLYFSPRSEDEYREYLDYGDEAVREGRGWAIGTRAPLMGGRVKYMRPNYFRRWHSHWTEADNVDISNPNYSFLPNLQNPLAPLNLLLHRDWWGQKHKSDRPYIPGGTGVGRPQSALHPDETFLTINSHSAYGPLAIGEIGGGFPISMTGGGEPFGLDPYSRAPKGVILSHGQTGVTTGRQGSGRLMPGGDKIRLGLHKGIDTGDLESWNPLTSLRNFVEGARTQAGLYGAIMQRLPIFPGPSNAFQRQDSDNTRSFARMAWMGEYGELTGPLGEFVRRFVQPDTQGYDAYNPLPNNMPSWLPDQFKTGDPYMRAPGIGELQLPGDAYEKTHPWVAPLRLRGSSIGLSEEEMIEKWLDPTKPIEGEMAEDIVGFGSAAHLQIQRQLKAEGKLVGAEVSIYDKEHNISGTMDAVIRDPSGLKIVEIKTQGAKSWGEVPDKYKDQLTFYMATTGIHHGVLAFVNRDNPQQVRFEDVEYDENRMQNVIDRAERARSVMRQMVDEGTISPFETYDLVSRIEILSKVAPESPEFRKHVEFALQGGLGGFEKQRVEQAVKNAQLLKQEYNLYPRRFGVPTETRDLRVESVNGDGTITTEMGTISLAGLKFDNQSFAYEDANDLLAKYGIKEGHRIPVTLIQGQFNKEVMNDVTLPAIVGNANKDLIRDEVADAETDSRNPLASKVVYGDPLLSKVWEWVAHTDNMITNKFLRVRTALEQFERGEVFGTDRSKWDDPIGNFIKPTINSFIRKDPITAGLQSGIVASLFFRTNKANAKLPNMKAKAFKYAAIAGATISLLRGVYERMTDSTWTPKAYRDQTEFDQYWDILEYLKFSSVAEQAKKQAKKREGVDIDQLRSKGARETVGLGPWAVLAIDAERKAKRTVYGFEEATGSLQDAIAALPNRQQQIAEEIVLSGTLNEKERFYKLLPDSEKRILGKFLGVDHVPDKPNLSAYFEKHFLPDVDWAGWQRSSDMNDLRTRAGEKEGMMVERPNRIKTSKARAYSHNVSIPRMDNPTVGNIRKQILALLSGQGMSNVTVNFDMRPSDTSVVNVDMDLFEDQTRHLLDHMREDVRRG